MEECKKGCKDCKKRLMIKMILLINETSASAVAKELHVHKSVISKHISGERPYPPFEKYINQMFLQC